MNRRPLLIALICLAALAGGWSALWYWSAGALEHALAQWTEHQRQRGVTIRYAGPTFEGFPFGLGARFGEPSAVADKGWHWQGPEVTGAAQVWAPFTIESAFPGKHVVSLRPEPDAPAAAFEAEARAATASTELRRDGLLERAAIRLTGLVVRPPLGGPASAESLTAEMAPAPPAPEAAEQEHTALAAAATGVTLPAQLDTPLGRAIESASLEAMLVGRIPQGDPKAALARWRDAGGKLEVTRLATVWGPMRLEAEGTATLDQDFRPAGAFTARVIGLLETIDALARAGTIPSGQAIAVRIAVIALGGSEDGDLVVPITLQGGQLYLGPVPLFRLSPVL